MIYVICNILVLFKNHLNYLNDNIFECFLRIIIKEEAIFFFVIYNDEKSKA